MDLMAEVKRKNRQLLLRRAQLQMSFRVRANTPYFNSFVVTFIVAPFLMGAATHLATTPMGALYLPVCRKLLLLWRQ